MLLITLILSKTWQQCMSHKPPTPISKIPPNSKHLTAVNVSSSIVHSTFFIQNSDFIYICYPNSSVKICLVCKTWAPPQRVSGNGRPFLIYLTVYPVNNRWVFFFKTSNWHVWMFYPNLLLWVQMWGSFIGMIGRVKICKSWDVR